MKPIERRQYHTLGNKMIILRHSAKLRNNKEYHQYRITIPEGTISALDWSPGIELLINVSEGKLIISKKG